MTGMRWIRSESRSVGGTLHDKEREDYQSDSSDGLGMRKENKSGNEEENNGDVREGKGKYMQKKGEMACIVGMRVLLIMERITRILG
ncbi:hypothetical protein KY290_010842 [Solanum tuberosum]|uniref:Uncharacterized protein n=1 Tax=Solanum tuberosum TaxID=4113 RepID=A0ABQ7VZE1_SOLTU|nr:hypothetical protein KY290_010842 [Solanum tuberosum]